MAITQAMTTSFKAQLMLAVHDFRPSADTGADVFKLALYSSTASLDANTTTYTSSDEVSSSGTNYTAGGGALTNLGATAVNTNASAGTGFVDFGDLTFANSNANTALTNASVAVLDFGSDKTATNGDFTIIFPTATNTTAIIRIA